MPTPLPTHYRAFRIHHDEGGHRAGIETLPLPVPAAGELLVRTVCSSVNYKDALAGTGRGKILRRFPLTGGIDVAGHVVRSGHRDFREGDAVIATGCGLSETRDGGYGEYALLPVSAAIALPAGLTLEEAMLLGTAGFTAALALLRMQENRQTPANGPIAITGASGGVGTLATAIFSQAGFEVHAFSSKPVAGDWLRQLGAAQVLPAGALTPPRPLETPRFGGALDTLGGTALASLLAQTAPYGNVACIGMARGSALESSLMPFILRGVSLLGIAAAGTARALREQVWAQLAGQWKPARLDAIGTGEVSLAGLPAAFARMLDGQTQGRILVRP